MTVRRLRLEMPSSEFTDWIAFHMNEQQDKREAEALAAQKAKSGNGG